jgi:hypothetical protein
LVSLFTIFYDKQTSCHVKNQNLSIGQSLSETTIAAGTISLWNGALMLFFGVILTIIQSIAPVIEYWLRPLVDIGLGFFDRESMPLSMFVIILAWGGLSAQLLIKMKLMMVPIRYGWFVLIRIIHIGLSLAILHCLMIILNP